MVVVLVTGGFDPIHSGHIEYFKAARALGNILVVGVNSDEWLTRKKGRPFMPMSERMKVISNLKMVDYAFEFDDDDGSAKDAIRVAAGMFPTHQIIFANGGDRTPANIPEMSVRNENVIFKFGVGGQEKLNSSSWILEEWKAPKVQRVWGYYRVLYEEQGCKVKELVINPGNSLSMQRHKQRAEHWHVAEGMCNVICETNMGYNMPARTLVKEQTVDIPAGQWHQLCNPFTAPCKVVEIQYGPYCGEDDIERKP